LKVTFIMCLCFRVALDTFCFILYRFSTNYIFCIFFVTAFSANGKDVIVDFPQQSHWTGLLSEMELVPSIHPGVT